MAESEPPPWLVWARDIQALCQIGLTHSDSQYETQRYQRLMEIAAEIVHSHTGLATGPLLDSFVAQPGYEAPKVDVRGAVLRDGQILLVQERSDERWCMPGGWADVGELPSTVVVREVWEESGFHVVPRKLLGVCDANRSGTPLEFYHAYKIVYLCELAGGRASPSNETLAVDFFSFDNLPPVPTTELAGGT
jgi:ADP-ribose pyrophosphatase YjhB (NUDIX family)